MTDSELEAFFASDREKDRKRQSRKLPKEALLKRPKRGTSQPRITAFMESKEKTGYFKSNYQFIKLSSIARYLDESIDTLKAVAALLDIPVEQIGAHHGAKEVADRFKSIPEGSRIKEWKYGVHVSPPTTTKGINYVVRHFAGA